MNLIRLGDPCGSRPSVYIRVWTEPKPLDIAAGWLLVDDYRRRRRQVEDLAGLQEIRVLNVEQLESAEGERTLPQHGRVGVALQRRRPESVGRQDHVDRGTAPDLRLVDRKSVV